MRVVDLEGAGVREFLRRALANDVAKLKTPGKALYSCMLNEEGGVIDDLIVYFFREDCFRLVVNAGTAEKDIAWLERLRAQSGRGDHDQAAPRPRDRRGPGPAARARTSGRPSRDARRDRGRSAPFSAAHRRRRGWSRAPATPARTASR